MWRPPAAWTDLDALAACGATRSRSRTSSSTTCCRAGELAELFAILDDEPVERYDADLCRSTRRAGAATAPSCARCATRSPRRSRRRCRGSPASAVARADLRAYAYRAGHYLLPHSDHQDGLARRLAYAYYLPSPEPPAGGELELFRCATRGELVDDDARADRTAREPARRVRRQRRLAPPGARGDRRDCGCRSPDGSTRDAGRRAVRARRVASSPSTSTDRARAATRARRSTPSRATRSRSRQLRRRRARRRARAFATLADDRRRRRPAARSR